jgi:tetratricopeptide (TPR) repeat protein
MSQARKNMLWADQRIHSAVALQNTNATSPEAEAIYQEILARAPTHPDSLHLLGLLHFHRGNYELAHELISQAIQHYDQEPVYHNNLSAVLVEMNRYAEACVSVDNALRLNPDLLDAINNKSLILPSLKRWEEAINLSRRYLEANPNSARAWFNLGVSMQEWGQHEESIPVYQKCIELDPTQVQAIVNMANAHKELSNWGEAQRVLTQAEAVDPNFGEIYNIRAAILKEIGKPNQAIAVFGKAQELYPKKAKHYEYNKSLCQLLTGVMPHGWVGYEHRWNVIDMPEAFKYELPWLGEDLSNKILVISREQGQGDFLQFCRYVPMIKARWPTCTIKLNVDRGMEELMTSLEGVDEILPTDDRIYDLVYDKWIPIVSLAWIFSTTVETIPNRVPYLHADTDLVDAWRKRVNKDRIRVGLVWSGGHRELEPKIWSTNKRRNCEWSMFEQMILKVHAARPDIEFYSLQKGDPAESELADRMKTVDLPIVNLMPNVKSWMDTAALASNMDLVITVDTSMVHLAGALALPVWMLNRLDTCWRWFLRRTDSPWYPTLRIFRQTTPKNWQPVVDEITQNLIDFKP